MHNQEIDKTIDAAINKALGYIDKFGLKKDREGIRGLTLAVLMGWGYTINKKLEGRLEEHLTAYFDKKNGIYLKNIICRCPRDPTKHALGPNCWNCDFRGPIWETDLKDRPYTFAVLCRYKPDEKEKKGDG